MERGTSRYFSERCNRPRYMEMSYSDHWRRPRSRSPVSYRRPLPVERRHGYGHQYRQSMSRVQYARPDRSSDRHSHRPSPPSKRPRLEQVYRESSRDGRRDRQPSGSPATARPSTAMATVSRAPASATPEPCVTFPELWGTYMTEAMEQQLDGWREETRQAQASDPGSARGHSVAASSSRASSVRSHDGPLPQSSCPTETRAGSKRSHDGQRRESSCAGSWRGGYKRSWDDVQDECPSPAKMFINRDHPRFSRY